MTVPLGDSRGDGWRGGEGKSSPRGIREIVHEVVRFNHSARAQPIFTRPGFAGGSSLGEGRALPGEAPTLPLEDSREGEGEAPPPCW